MLVFLAVQEVFNFLKVNMNLVSIV